MPPSHAYSDIRDAIPPPVLRGAAVTSGLLRNRCRWVAQFKKTGWIGPSSGKREGNDRDRRPRPLTRTPLRESECSAFIWLTTLAPYFNVRWLIYSTDWLARGRAWKLLESIELMFQWFFWWNSLKHFSIAFPFVFVIEYWLFVRPLIIFPIQLLFLRQRVRLWHRSSWTVVILSNRLVERLHNFWLRWMVKYQYWFHLSAVDKQYWRALPRLSSLDAEGKRGSTRLSL